MDINYQLKNDIFKCCKSLDNFKQMSNQIVEKIRQDKELSKDAFEILNGLIKG